MFEKGTYQYRNFQSVGRLARIEYILEYIIFEKIEDAVVELYRNSTDNTLKFKLESQQDFVVDVDAWEKMAEIFQTEKINSGEYRSDCCGYGTCDWELHSQVFELLEIPDGLLEKITQDLE
jgi:hypothetical protein